MSRPAWRRRHLTPTLARRRRRCREPRRSRIGRRCPLPAIQRGRPMGCGANAGASTSINSRSVKLSGSRAVRAARVVIANLFPEIDDQLANIPETLLLPSSDLDGGAMDARSAIARLLASPQWDTQTGAIAEPLRAWLAERAAVPSFWTDLEGLVALDGISDSVRQTLVAHALRVAPTQQRSTRPFHRHLAWLARRRWNDEAFAEAALLLQTCDHLPAPHPQDGKNPTLLVPAKRFDGVLPAPPVSGACLLDPWSGARVKPVPGAFVLDGHLIFRLLRLPLEARLEALHCAIGHSTPLDRALPESTQVRGVWLDADWPLLSEGMEDSLTEVSFEQARALIGEFLNLHGIDTTRWTTTRIAWHACGPAWFLRTVLRELLRDTQVQRERQIGEETVERHCRPPFVDRQQLLGQTDQRRGWRGRIRQVARICRRPESPLRR